MTSTAVRPQVSHSTLDDLARQRRWSELRAAAVKDDKAIFYRAMAAAVFNDPEAESLFRQVIRDEPNSEHAYQAHNWLANLYQKSGRYHSLTAICEAQWKSFPDRKEIKSQKKEDAPFVDLPDQVNGPHTTSRFHHDGHSLPAPATINGKQVKFFFDNGADLSCISQNEAKRLGMKFSNAVGSMGTMTKNVGFRMATAKDVVIGQMHFRDVSFAVFPDDQPPMSLVPIGHRGVIGLPLMVAIGTFRWDAKGSLVIGEESRHLRPDQSNLIFDAGDHVVLSAKFQGEQIWASFDSGARTTDIYAPFSRRFSSYLLERGKVGNNSIIGIGGAENYEAIDVPELSFQIDGKSLSLKPAHIMTKREDHRDWIFANVGKDLYMQTSGFVLDFQAMRLTLN